MGAVLAHQGGWDELMLVLGPIAIILGLLYIAKRRADRFGGTPTDVPPPLPGRPPRTQVDHTDDWR